MRRAIILIPLVLVGISSSAGQVRSQTDTSALFPYVYRIRAGNCPIEPAVRIQTGFRIEEEVGIITALHGVAECKEITAQSGNDVLDRLSVVKVDLDRDVALLWSESLAAMPKARLKKGTLTSQPGVITVEVIGYPRGLARPKVTFDAKITGRAQLIDLLPDKFSHAFVERNSPSTGIDVLNVQAPITEGHSGAPFIDQARRVVGIGSGGLDSGFWDSAWAIPISDVAWVNVSNKVPGRYSASAAQRLRQLARMNAKLVFQVVEEEDPSTPRETAVPATAAPDEAPGASSSCPRLNPFQVGVQQLAHLQCSEGGFVADRYVVTQEFEHGFMIVFDDPSNSRFTKLNQRRKFYALDDTGRAWRVFFTNEAVLPNTSDRPEDWFTCQKPANAAPPQESGIPWRGFGLVWCNYPEIRQALGYVRRGASETLSTAPFQSYSKGRVFGISNRTYVVSLDAGENAGDEPYLTGIWEFARR